MNDYDRITETIMCPTCEGDGYVSEPGPPPYNRKCDLCGGQGLTKDEGSLWQGSGALEKAALVVLRRRMKQAVDALPTTS